ncbi:SDR family oxidoreductase [Micromonospora sp. R77]|nr:SDR family oxidoreductase [Micromonospora sp. R77]MCI4066318.1 SDR family oxidoreductase [Micromonospora sp. R77]
MWPSTAVSAATPAFADAVAWLLSDHAGYIHGAEIAVDGGITATRTG